MALFSDNKNDSKKTSSSSRTFISKKMEVTGNFKGKGAVQVEGILHGNISVDSVVIGEQGVVNGIIEAKNVIINGKLKGSIECDSLEVMRNGTINNKVTSKNLKVSGEIAGKINVIELLDIRASGSINGDISMGRIKIEDGARIIGSIKENLQNNKIDPKTKQNKTL